MSGPEALTVGRAGQSPLPCGPTPARLRIAAARLRVAALAQRRHLAPSAGGPGVGGPLLCTLGIACLLLAAGPVRAQTREGGDIGASSQSVKQGALQPLGTRQLPPPPTAASPPPAAATPPAPHHPPITPNVGPAPGSPPTVLPPPSSYLSSAWNIWPHAWAYVPNLWSAWYRDFVLQSRPATAAETVGTEPSHPTRPDQPEVTPTAPVVVAPAPKLSEPEIAVLPAPRLIRRRRYNLVISGIGILAATWAADRLLANGLSAKPETWVPLVGPWFLLAEQSALASPSRQVQVFLGIDALLQAGGLSMAILGFVLTTKHYVVTVDPLRSDAVPRAAP